MKKVNLPDNSGVKFTFDGLPDVVVFLAAMAVVNQSRMACAGISQRIGDNAAIMKGPENNYRVTETLRREAVVELADHYTSGSVDWSPKAAAKRPAQNATWAALAAARGVSYDTIAAEKAEADIRELMEMTTMVAPRGDQRVIDVESREVIEGQLAITQ